MSLCTDSFMDVLMELSSNSLVSKVEVSSSRLKSGCSAAVPLRNIFLCVPILICGSLQIKHHLRAVSRLVVVGQ